MPDLWTHPCHAYNSVYQGSHCSALLIGCVKYCSRLYVMGGPQNRALFDRKFRIVRIMQFLQNKHKLSFCGLKMSKIEPKTIFLKFQQFL